MNKIPVPPLLAKSTGRRGPVTLVGHTRDVMNAAAAMLGTSSSPTTFALEWCNFFGLDRQRVGDLIRNVHAAAFCHDWGKANDGFQRALNGGSQLLRHEQVSAILMCLPGVWPWFRAGTFDAQVVLAAVVGHHLKIRDAEDLGRPQSAADVPMLVHWDDSGLQAFLSATAPQFGLSASVPQDVPRRWQLHATGPAADLAEATAAVYEQLNSLDRVLRAKTPEADARRRMLWATRAALVAADSAGSGLDRNGRDVAEWIKAAFDPAGRLNGDVVRTRIIGQRLAGKTLRPFQHAAADPKRLPARSLLLAPCGFGKTLAAWQWIAARLDERPRGRAIFLYPTRGTATEGYRDYAGQAGEDVAALMHGTADLDLDTIEGDVSTEKRTSDARLFALRQWPKRVFSATVDQFLGFMQHGYAATCQLPLLADSVLVIDEVHSYDRGMWSALIEFLKTFPNLPVLCMTATMLARRIDDLRDVGLPAINGLDLDGGEGSDLTRAARHKRYRVRRVADQDEAKDAVAAALADGKKVLWVVNTVDRCQAIARSFADDPAADELSTPDGLPVFCYHSRYRLDDRKTWHEAVVAAFKPGGTSGAVLAVTTQVCEMSLDLDADLLVTERCPATALVQRMGRCCRDARAHESGRVGDVVVYSPEKDLPYGKDDLTGVDGVIDTMPAEGVVSQERLAELLEDVSPPVELHKSCRFVDSGVWAASGEEQFRDSDDLSRQAVLAEDVDEYARRRKQTPSWDADALVMNVPKTLTQEHGRHDLPPWLRMARGGTYRTALGYCGKEAPTASIL